MAGRLLYTDDFYDDREIFFDEEEDSPIWDLDEMHIEHLEGQELVGDEGPRVSHYGKGPKGYNRSDALIHEEVCDALTAHSNIDATNIDVTVDNGIVFLKGHVPNRSMKRRAGKCVEDILGVKDVFNEITIQK